MKKIYHFLGGVTFALILIAATALMVIAGTFIEAKTGSHRFAALFTYSSPLFSVLLCGFFINILFAALRRWPFRTRHIPFLITHLGLLMIIAGTLIKQFFGIQGIMLLTEGRGSNTLLIPDTYIVHIDHDGDHLVAAEIPLTAGGHHLFPDLHFRLQKHYSHSKERYTSWIKGDRAEILGLQPFPVYDEKEESEKLPVSTRVRFESHDEEPWNLYALRSDDAKRAIRRVHQEKEKALVFVATPDGDTFIAALDPQSILAINTYPATVFDRLFVYKEGFGGYTMQYELPTTAVTLETFLSSIFTPLPPTSHLEENIPLIVFDISEGKNKETIALRYDRLGNGLYTPALNGKYRLRFQPQHVTLPHHLELLSARKISYANSTQPFSYECDIQEGTTKKTICMNEVYETEDGYRFYLSSISSADDTAVKHVQLAVNYDPTKYILLIPGTFLIGIGIVWLFGRSLIK